LLPEAEPMMRYVLRDVLQRSLPGVQLHDASSVARALDLLTSQRPRVRLLADLVPTVNRALRKNTEGVPDELAG
jgi:hypothetical protein